MCVLVTNKYFSILFECPVLCFDPVIIRLVRQTSLESFHEQMTEFKEELDDAVGQLDEQYASLKSAARQRLGSLYDEADYPMSLAGLFDVGWDYPSIEPPSYLQQLNPELYEQECRRTQARFDEAVRMAEQAFIEELSKLVSHLTERLAGQDDGRPKIFRDSAVGNLREFFDRFRSLNVRSNEQLDALVTQCQQVVRGVEPQELRDNGGLRQQLRRSFRACSPFSTACWWTDRGGALSGHPSKDQCYATRCRSKRPRSLCL